MPNIYFWILLYFGPVLLANRVHNRVRILRIHTHTHTHFQTQYPYPPHTHFFTSFHTHTRYKWDWFFGFRCNSHPYMEARYTSISHSRRVRRRAAPRGVNCRQPNLTLSVTDFTTRTRDLLVTQSHRDNLTVAPRLSFLLLSPTS